MLRVIRIRSALLCFSGEVSETDIRVSASLFFTSVNGVFLSLCVSLFRVCVCVYYEVCKVPSS